MILLAFFTLVTIAAVTYAAFEAKILIWFWFRRPARRPQQSVTRGSNATAPNVTVQLPLFNEGTVAINLIDAVARLDYPADKLHIQILDDSTDSSPDLTAQAVRRWAAAGVDIVHIRRSERIGFKAGALAEGLALTTSPFVAVFDADFLPPQDYLRRVLIDGKVFDDPKVAFLQGRWSYTNEDQNPLTRMQAVLLDRHFYVQKPYQLVSDRTTIFNGSAGIWRRSAIDSVGGWSGETLCEDLDLSYRCALAGYSGAYEQSLACPSEIPANITAFKLQQRRWAKGSAQCMRKLFGDVLRSERLQHRWDDLYSIVGYIIHPILLAYSLLWPWIVMAGLPDSIVWFGQIYMAAANAIAITGFATTIIASGRSVSVNSALDVVLALVLGMSLMVNNTMAFISGCFQSNSLFERTPKQGRSQARIKPDSLHWGILIEALTCIYAALASLYLAANGKLLLAMPTIMFGLCMAFIIVYQIWDKVSYRATATLQPGT